MNQVTSRVTARDTESDLDTECLDHDYQHKGSSHWLICTKCGDRIEAAGQEITDPITGLDTDQIQEGWG